MKTVALTGLAVFALDQASKWFVVQRLNLQSVGEIEVMPPYLTFRMAWNRGVNFGLFGNDSRVMPYVLIGLSLAIAVAVLIWTWKTTDWRVRTAAGLLIGGAVGNALDRAIYGAVADFLNMSCCGISNPYAFNVADIAIFAGAIGLIIWGDAGKAQKSR